MFIPELLCPAGNMDRLETCITYGADAVYLGGSDFNLRAKNANFSNTELIKAISYIKKHNKKVYLCLNIYAYEEQIPAIKEYLHEIKDLDIDGIIAADPGIITLLKLHLPNVPIHLSTQANTSNSQSIKFWKELGIKRVNLARELNMRQIKNIRAAIPDIELETFVHGAMCMAISGRCHLSAYLNSRPANQGMCTHPCRFSYKIKGVAVEEEQRPGKILWEYFEDQGFSSFFAAQDLCLIKYLKWFISNRINCLKIEGRMKTSSYLGPVVDVYSTALKDIGEKNFRLGYYLKELTPAHTRTCNTGFFLPHKRINIISPPDIKQNIVFKVIEVLSKDKYLVSIRHKIDLSKDLEILVPGLKRPKIPSNKYAFEDKSGKKLREVNSGIHCFFRFATYDLKENYLVREVI